MEGVQSGKSARWKDETAWAVDGSTGSRASLLGCPRRSPLAAVDAALDLLAAAAPISAAAAAAAAAVSAAHLLDAVAPSAAAIVTYSLAPSLRQGHKWYAVLSTSDMPDDKQLEDGLSVNSAIIR